MFIAQWLAQTGSGPSSQRSHQCGVAAYPSLESDIQVFSSDEIVLISDRPASLVDLLV